MKILNLYAGLGGNAKHWYDHEITAVEYDPKIAAVYKRLYPDDLVVVADAPQYLLEHAHEFDFIWSSPPCQSHSRMIRSGRNRRPRYVDLQLYSEIMFLMHDFDGYWCVENVVPFYKPFIEPSAKVGRHLFWSNFDLGEIAEPPPFKNFINRQNLNDKQKLMDWLDIHYEENLYYEGNHCPTQILRNCVHPVIGEQIMQRLEQCRADDSKKISKTSA